MIRRLKRLMMMAHFALTYPISILFILDSARIQKEYRMTLLRKLRLGFRMLLNKRRVQTGTSSRAHLAMALKLLETPSDVPGDVVECGSWKGGSAANLSLVCKIVGRKLIIFDSFEGLPGEDITEKESSHYSKGDFTGTLEEVKENIRRCGCLEVCEFVKGWFSDTLPGLKRPVLLAHLDVDLEASLATCVRHVWPHLNDNGWIFTDEACWLDYVSLFFSEKWWRKNFNAHPPGLIGAGTGLLLGEYYIGPASEMSDHPFQHASTGAYTSKSMSSHWTYYPDEDVDEND